MSEQDNDSKNTVEPTGPETDSGDDRGASLMDYGVIAALIIMIAIAALPAVGTSSREQLCDVISEGQISDATAPCDVVTTTSTTTSTSTSSSTTK